MKKHSPFFKQRKTNKHVPKSSSLNNKKLYRDPRWKELREMHLSIQGSCVVCGTKDRLHVDHVKAHEGDLKLFFDPDNLQTLCHKHHSVKTSAVDCERDEEGRFVRK